MRPALIDIKQRKHWQEVVCALILLALSGPLLSGRAQTSPPPQPPPLQEELQNEDDPTKAVFFSVRNELFNLQGAWTNVLILRTDRAFLKEHGWLGGKAGLLTRYELPVVTRHAGGATRAGLGDLYAQFVYVPWLTPRFALAAGSGFAFPTATDKTLGSGKWRAAPLVAPVWFLPRRKGFFLVKFQQHVSLAGDTERPDINFLLTTPTLLYRFQRKWWLLTDTEMKADWGRDNRISLRSGVGIGRMLGSHFGLSVKPGIPWGPHREGDWALKVVITRYRSN